MGMKHGHEWSDMYTQSTRAAGLRVYISGRQRETSGIMKLATCAFPLKLEGPATGHKSCGQLYKSL